MTNQTSNKSIINRFHSAFGSANGPALRDLLSSGFVMHGLPPEFGSGADGLIKMAAEFKAAMSDCNNTIEDLVAAEDNKVVARFTTRAVHTGRLFGTEASGRRVTLTGMELYRLSDGKIAELWGEYNMGDLFEPTVQT